MPTKQNTEPTQVTESWLDRQERRMREQLHRTSDREGATDAFISFLESAPAQDITRLFCALSNYQSGREVLGREMNLAECFTGAQSAGEPFAAPSTMESARAEDPAEGDDDEGEGGIPDWTTETPRESQYDLEMFDWDGNEQQRISLSRGEFVQLKEHLAKMRGLEVNRG